MKLIVGLGNPGTEYQGTRHNIGFEVLEAYAQTKKIDLSKTKFEAFFGEGEIKGEKVILALPQTYMNLSGRSVLSFLNFFKMAPEDLLVLHDELDLALGKMKFVRGGGAAGHRGVLSIQEMLGTKEFSRIRMGIGRPLNSEQVVDFVLKKFQKAERELLEPLILKSVKGLDLWLEKGVEAAIQFCHQN